MPVFTKPDEEHPLNVARGGGRVFGGGLGQRHVLP